MADTSVLLGELLRASGRARLSDQRLELFISAHAWSEFTHELPRRIAAFARRHELAADQEALLMQVCLDAVGANIGLVEEAVYAPVEDEARSRSLLDPDDWPQVACALVLDAGIWTLDNDFLGTGIATWTTDSLRQWLERNRPE
ncbi:MAG: PIN domain-containing protein [Mycobacteriales bacterium]